MSNERVLAGTTLRTFKLLHATVINAQLFGFFGARLKISWLRISDVQKDTLVNFRLDRLGRSRLATLATLPNGDWDVDWVIEPEEYLEMCDRCSSAVVTLRIQVLFDEAAECK